VGELDWSDYADSRIKLDLLDQDLLIETASGHH
jgi:hypothetical protein